MLNVGVTDHSYEGRYLSKTILLCSTITLNSTTRMLRDDVCTDSSGRASSNDEYQAKISLCDDSMEEGSSRDELNKVLLEESMNPAEESRCTTTDNSEEEDDSEEVEESVAQDMALFAQTFKGIESRYRLINRIGEGTLRLYITDVKEALEDRLFSYSGKSNT